MEEQHFTLYSSDRLELFGRLWIAEAATSRAVICLVHGMGEHSGRYEGAAAALTSAGYIVMTYDQRGHGRSPGLRGHSDSMEQLSGDAEALITLAGQRYPGLPRLLYGHSMGGAVALSCAVRRKPPLAGLIITSPWLRLTSPPSSLKQWIGRSLERIWPTFSFSTGLKSADLYRQDEPRPSDPLNHTSISAAMYFALAREGEWLLQHTGFHEAEAPLPLLLLHGSVDNITSWRASEQLAQIYGDHCTFIAWENGYHELHHDEDREQVLRIIVKWINGTI